MFSGNYDEAIDNYSKALDAHVPKRKECNIRVNYALSICNTVNLDEISENSINNAIKKYENALDILEEDNCADSDGFGHDDDAQELYDDIQKEIKRLKKLSTKTNNSDNNNDSDDRLNQDKTLEEKIRDVKEEAIKEQREKENLYKGLNKKYNDTNKRW